MNKKYVIGIVILGILLAVGYILVPTYKKTLVENEKLTTKVSTLEQEKKELQTEYERYKKNYQEDTVVIKDPTILPNGSLAIDGHGNPVYKVSITHKKNVVIDDERSKQTITDLTTRIVEKDTEIERLKKLTIAKREIRRVCGVTASSSLEDMGVWVDAQLLGPVWAGADVITPDIRSGFSIKDTKVYARLGYGF